MPRSRFNREHMGFMALLTGVILVNGCTLARRTPSRTATASGMAPATADWTLATAVLSPADVDSTTSPCQDFYQYATGGWYRRVPLADRSDLDIGPGQARAGIALRRLAAAAPALAATTHDPTLRAVGYFYGSCLADTTGTAQGAIGDTSRTRDCFRTTRQYLDRALFELLLEYMWPPAARAASRQIWPNMVAATVERFQASTVLPDSIKHQNAVKMASIKLHLTMDDGIGFRPSEPRDSLFELWRHADPQPAGSAQGGANLPLTNPALAWWTYRNYTNLGLSPTDFARNLARVRAAPDSIPLPDLPQASGKRKLLLLDLLLNRNEMKLRRSDIEFGMLIPPIPNGTLDLGAWYGMFGSLLGHEIGHGLLIGFAWNGSGPVNRVAFAAEQFRRQLELYQDRDFMHSFPDELGVLIAYDAFTRATRGRTGPVIDGFTPEQRFFLGVARGWRGGVATLRTNYHAIVYNNVTRWRILTNGTLSAMPAFARAFGCQAGDPMAGGHVWYQAPWRGVALTPEHRMAFYRWYAAFFELTPYLVFAPSFNPKLQMTAVQTDSLGRLFQAHTAQWYALLDSLGTTPDSGAADRRLRQLAAREYSEARALLLPTQQAVLDSLIRAEMGRYAPTGSSGP